MRVVETAVYRGPHYYSARPMVRVRLDLQQLEHWPTDRLPAAFVDALLAALPGLERHGCSYRQPGGLVRRMRDGTWLGHVIEHACLELQVQAGASVTRGKTRSVKGAVGVYDVLYAYETEGLARASGRLAVALVESLLPSSLRGVEGLERIAPPVAGEAGLPGALDEAMAQLARIARREALGPTTASLVHAARRRGIPVQRLDEQSLVQFGHGARRKLIRASITGQTSQIAVQTASDKDLTKRLLSAVGVPAPRGAVVRTLEEALAAAERIKGPVVVKPLDGNHGRGVSLDLKTPEQVRWGFEQAARHGRRMLVEEQFVGRDHRILVIGGKVAAVAERTPAAVTGDGISPIRALIEAVNRDPRRGVGHEKVMTRIVVDDHVREVLTRAGLDLDAVPEVGRVVALRATANLSTGGAAIDRTDEIHPDNASIAQRAALAIGLDVAGVDFIAPDIRRSVRETGGGVIEVNAAPGFRMHLEPSEGKPRDVARAVLDTLYPPGTTSRVPIVAITGTNGKSTVSRMVTAIFRAHGKTVGLTNTSGVYIDDEQLMAVDASGPRSARIVLSDPSVEVVVLETARGGILREGLAFDRCDVGMVLNIGADHLGLKGVETLEDLARVKSVVTEAVGRRGVSILNGDDPMTLRIARHAGGRIAYFTLNGGPEMSPFLQKHVAEGGLLAAREPSIHGGDLVVHDRGRRIPLMSAHQIPATLSGLAEFNTANALAALLAGHVQKVPVETMARALGGFASSHADNPGRFNVHDAHGFRVIVDYAHNPAALQAIGRVVEGLRPRIGRAIGVVSIPGDRRDEDIREMGQIAAGLFDELIFRERPDGRGRTTGSVVALLTEGALAAGFPEARLHRILSEAKAIDLGLRLARPGDLVMLFPTAVDAVWRQVQAFQPTGDPDAGQGAAAAGGLLA